MTLNGFLSLAWQSITEPRDVARLLLSIRPGSEALLTGFALVIVLNGLLYGVTSLLGGGSASDILGSPTVFMAMQAGTLAATIVAFTFVGRFLGGIAGLEQVALLMIWLQALRVVGQVIVIVLQVVAGAFAGIAVLAITAIGVWIAVHFLDEAHGLDNLFKALVVLILGVLAMAIALSLVLTAFGVTPQGITGYV